MTVVVTNNNWVHKIAYGFGGPSEEMSVLINFLLQNTNLVSVLSQIFTNFASHVWQDWQILWTLQYRDFLGIFPSVLCGRGQKVENS